jgi:asparagine synthase (glutamine-hydrolysing)
MCGICGLVTPLGAPPVQRELVERMRDTLVHRGPDGAGVHVDGQIGLGHRRLAIVDVAHGHQPMHSPDERIALVYNGEVFNHPELQRRLEADGVVYRTRSDTETVLHLYRRHGTAFVEQLRGMFAIAVWDRDERTLVLARDRFGVKPLYYVHGDDGTLWFASEIKALVEGGAVSAVLNEAAFPDFLANHAPSGNDTLFAGVRRLPPGHVLTWRDGTIALHRYWDLPVGEGEQAKRSHRDLVTEYGERFTEAVRLRLMSDVPLGMFLSGGIDSSAITAVMSTLVQEPIKTFSVAFAEREANEFAYARQVATRYRTDHHEVVLGRDEFFSLIPQLLWQEDEPMAHPSSVALFAVSRLAAQQVKVVLTGEGSDETLAGYNRYRMTSLFRRFGHGWDSFVPGAVRRAVAGGVSAAAPHFGLARKLARTPLVLPSDLDTLYFDNFAVFGRARQQQLLAPAVRDRLAAIDPYAAHHAAMARRDGRPLLEQLLYTDSATYLHELLMKQDQMSMAASIESRVPFLDHPLVEWVTGLPASLKLKGLTTKVILREAMRDKLPPEILSRKKMGFPVPVGAWLRTSHRHVVDEFVLSERALQRGLFDPHATRTLVHEHQTDTANHDSRLWSLLNLEVWHRLWIDGESIGDVQRSMGGAGGRRTVGFA